jgi:hypothetical protein
VGYIYSILNFAVRLSSFLARDVCRVEFKWEDMGGCGWLALFCSSWWVAGRDLARIFALEASKLRRQEKIATTLLSISSSTYPSIFDPGKFQGAEVS